jgi:hypothetical protein
MSPETALAEPPGRLDVVALRATLHNDGYVVFRSAVALERCRAVVEAIGTELGIRLDDAASWDAVSTVLDQVPLWGHQSQWDIRQDPSIHRIFSAVWGTEALWADRNSCRFTPPWRQGRAPELSLHWDIDPRDRAAQWFPGILALTDAGPGEGGFCCAPELMHHRDRWPASWPPGGPYLPDPGTSGEVIEVPLQVGDLLVFDHHLPHGTVRNRGTRPRAVFYLQLFPAGTAEEAAGNVADHLAGIAPPWWRSKPGHDRIEPGPPASLTALGRRLAGLDPW